MPCLTPMRPVVGDKAGSNLGAPIELRLSQAYSQVVHISSSSLVDHVDFEFRLERQPADTQVQCGGRAKYRFPDGTPVLDKKQDPVWLAVGDKVVVEFSELPSGGDCVPRCSGSGELISFLLGGPTPLSGELRTPAATWSTCTVEVLITGAAEIRLHLRVDRQSAPTATRYRSGRFGVHVQTTIELQYPIEQTGFLVDDQSAICVAMVDAESAQKGRALRVVNDLRSLSVSKSRPWTTRKQRAADLQELLTLLVAPGVGLLDGIVDVEDRLRATKYDYVLKTPSEKPQGWYQSLSDLRTCLATAAAVAQAAQRPALWPNAMPKELVPHLERVANQQLSEDEKKEFVAEARRAPCRMRLVALRQLAVYNTFDGRLNDIEQKLGGHLAPAPLPAIKKELEGHGVQLVKRVSAVAPIGLGLNTVQGDDWLPRTLMPILAPAAMTGMVRKLRMLAFAEAVLLLLIGVAAARGIPFSKPSWAGFLPTATTRPSLGGSLEAVIALLILIPALFFAAAEQVADGSKARQRNLGGSSWVAASLIAVPLLASLSAVYFETTRSFCVALWVLSSLTTLACLTTVWVERRSRVLQEIAAGSTVRRAAIRKLFEASDVPIRQWADEKPNGISLLDS